MSVDLNSEITKKCIDPAFEPTKLKAEREFLGIPDFETCHFVECEFNRFTRQFFENFIAPRIGEYLQSPEIKQLDNRVLSLDITSTFKPDVDARLRKLCTIIPGGFGTYPMPKGKSAFCVLL